MTFQLGIIGAGNMAEAIARGVLRGNLFTADQIIAADVAPQRRALFSNDLKIRAVETNAEVARQAQTLLLSVKPQMMAEALAGLGADLAPDALVISIAAGVSTRFIEQHLGAQHAWRVVRAMPNTPMLVGAGMTAIASGANATADDLGKARAIFRSAGDVIDVREDQIDAVTALSGSGPAYFFFLVEQMIQAGIELGLSPEDARKLASQTAFGAGQMLATSPDSPQELRRKVTSPGGTTHAAITHMESHGWTKASVDAVRAAARRSAELGK